MSKKVLLAGESWIAHTTHVKGMDSFHTSTYGESGKWLIEALEADGFEVTYMPSHLALTKFPFTMEELQKFDAVILSDIGSNTLLLNDDVFIKCQTVPDRLELIRDYVEQGGGFCMIGGYMSFTGIEGKARYNQTPIKDILPVEMLDFDDRCETCSGVIPVIEDSGSPVLRGVEEPWPSFLGYNKTIRREDADVVATVNGDPLIALREYGKGRTAVFTSDCAPHWGTMEFVNWKHYQTFWANLVRYICNK
ncbi:MAG: glutamine amidotransferase [Caldicoprobacterales bacterium]|jgi:uncharacterized membrane protein|nr:cytoplasmic protein [Clostridiales bacterium]